MAEPAANVEDAILTHYELKGTKSLSRLLLISYFPSGFWSRLMIRILADTQINEVGQNVYNIPIEVSIANHSSTSKQRLTIFHVLYSK